MECIQCDIYREPLFESDGKLKDGGGETAFYVRKGKDGYRRRAGDSSDDDAGSDYDWGNTRGGDACHRCGRPGHRLTKCIIDMPQRVKDKIIQDARKARRARAAGKEDAKLVHMESDAESDDDWHYNPIQHSMNVRANMASVDEPSSTVFISEELRDHLSKSQPKTKKK
ncbi:hypothetical protein D9611_012573 [Ephemerocybe angulata]|uniref:CCHC-type domain-containing protein n=1 Tax=Ephemerocybe angulata TaxID=980116 RepID=A0A8H5AV33_9AGAR|nr:hypothetical protein D9611_012573 [Tulosesus angulatus]